MTRAGRRELLSAALTHLEAAAKLLEEAEEEVLVDEARELTQSGRCSPSRSRLASLQGPLPRCYYFVEQCQHRSMTPDVVDFDECGGAVQRSHGLDGKIVSGPLILRDLIRRH